MNVAEPKRYAIEEDIIRAAAENIERLPMLERIFDRLAQGLAGSLRSFSGIQAETSIMGVDYKTAGDIIGQIDAAWLTAICDADQWSGQFLVALEPKLLFSLLEVLLGGRSAAPAEWSPRTFTSIEKRLAQQVTETILSELETAFAPIDKVRFSLAHFESSPQASMIAPAQSPATSVALSIDLDGRGGAVIFMLPHAALHHTRENLSVLSTGENIGQDDEWRTNIQGAISETSVKLTAILRQMNVPLGEMLTWRRGQVLDLGVSSEDEIQLATSGRVVARGSVGRRRSGSTAVRITSVNLA
ncbi:FliM/FliN family flagellar motor switch protein [Roseivivax sp. CAU 1753]